MLTKNWPSGPRDAHLMIGVSYFSKKSITIILSFHIAIHCWNLVCVLGFDYDGGDVIKMLIEILTRLVAL
jgi:hypothetical protein